MSYVGVPRANFETFQADGPWESGAPGWSTAPVPGWGMNPNQSLPRRQATAGCGCAAMGADAPAPAEAPAAQTKPQWSMLALLAGVAGVGAWAAFKLSQ